MVRTADCVLIREVSLIQTALMKRFHCMDLISLAHLITGYCNNGRHNSSTSIFLQRKTDGLAEPGGSLLPGWPFLWVSSKHCSKLCIVLPKLYKPSQSWSIAPGFVKCLGQHCWATRQDRTLRHCMLLRQTSLPWHSAITYVHTYVCTYKYSTNGYY